MDEIWVEVKKNYLLSNYGLLVKSVEGELMPVEPTELEDGLLQVELTVKMMRYRSRLATAILYRSMYCQAMQTIKQLNTHHPIHLFPQLIYTRLSGGLL